jgi:hypothetical protein
MPASRERQREKQAGGALFQELLSTLARVATRHDCDIATVAFDRIASSSFKSPCRSVFSIGFFAPMTYRARRTQ